MTTTTSRSTLATKSSDTMPTIKIARIEKNSSSLWHQMRTTLRWTSRPSRFIPHGLSGIITLSIGYVLTICSIIGFLAPFGVGPYKHYFMIFGNIKYWIYIFGFTSLINAVSGLMLIPAATKMAKPIFHKIAWIQICLIYYTFRFLPEVYMLFSIDTTDDDPNHNNNLKNNVTLKRGIIRCMDIIFCLIIIMATLGFGKDAIYYFQESKAISIAFVCSMFGVATLCIYPSHLVYDANWLTCTLSKYPIQGVAMTAYVYIPAITMIAFLSFVGTLNLRKMINNTHTAVLLIVCVFGILLIDVIAMEYWITDVSTQKLFLPCYDDDNTMIERQNSYVYLEDFFDLSRRTKDLIVLITGKEVPPPIHYEL